jgi:hypothetical protein
VAGSAFNRRANGRRRVYHASVGAVSSDPILISRGTVAPGTSRRHFGRIIFIPVTKGLGLDVIVAGAFPLRHELYHRSDLRSSREGGFNFDDRLHDAGDFDFRTRNFDLNFRPWDFNLDGLCYNPGHFHLLGLTGCEAKSHQK